jgi:CheY-like chemotaxis protein
VAPPDLPESWSREWKATGTVLVVDDEAAVRKVCRQVLERQGFTVLAAKDGSEGIETFHGNKDRIDVVLLDMTMPRMSGEETFRQLSLIQPDVQVVLMSGYSEQEAIDRFGVADLAGFVQKPFKPDQLLARIQDAILTGDYES